MKMKFIIVLLTAVLLVTGCNNKVEDEKNNKVEDKPQLSDFMGNSNEIFSTNKQK